MHIFLVEVKVKPDKRDKFLEVIRYDAAHSEADEPGCMRFDLLEDKESPNTFFFYEVYRDEAATEAHRAAPHYKVWNDARDEVLDGPVTRRVLTNMHPLDPAWR